VKQLGNPWTLREKAKAKQSRMGFLLRSAALVSKSNRMVDRRCKAGGDPAETIAKADRIVGEQETPVLGTERLKKIQLFLIAKPI
jgi:hypothetical protein